MEAAELLQTIGGPVGCRALSEAFYTRVKRDPVLRPFCPGASLRCVVEELTAFLVQLLDGPPEATQKRWLGQPRESHQRFCTDHAIELAEASAYIQQNRARHAALLGLLTTSDATAQSNRYGPCYGVSKARCRGMCG